MTIQREDAIDFVAYVVDDAGAARPLGDDQHAIVRETDGEFEYPSVLVGWQCGFEPLFVAVHSYLDVELDDDEAIELATDYLIECEWFSDGPTEPDHIIR